MKRIWNNVLDAREYLIDEPGEGISLLGFPSVSEDWLIRPEELLTLQFPGLADFAEVHTRVVGHARNREVCLVKLEAEESETEPSYFVSFGSRSTPSENLSFRLGLPPPDWSRLTRLSFSFSSKFITFAETFSDFCFGSGDWTPLLLPAPEWTRLDLAFPADAHGNVILPSPLATEGDAFLVIQQNYWGIVSLLDKNGQLWLADSSKGSMIKAPMTLGDWIDRELTQTPQPRSIAS
jgi:hypothetical protein